MPKFLFKASDAVLSHCGCTDAPASSTSQLDCPWCGCGWLIGCLNCRKAFTFAEVRETEIPLVEFARRDAAARGLTDISEAEFEEWAAEMAEMLDVFDVGDIVVYLDGGYFTVDSADVEFEGYFAAHRLDRLPHAEALQDPAMLDRVLGDKRYWLDRERPDRD